MLGFVDGGLLQGKCGFVVGGLLHGKCWDLSLEDCCKVNVGICRWRTSAR
jgi:hypothetical protein